MSAGLRRLLVVIVVVAGLAALFVFGILRDATRRDDIPSALIGRQAPDFMMPLFARYQTEYGRTFDTSRMRGQPMVVNFWASWCAPCRDEMPVLQATWQEYQNEVLFVGVDTQETTRTYEPSEALMDQFSLTYPSGKDEDNNINVNYGLFGVPETFFIRADGTVSYRHSGPVTQEIMTEQLRALLEPS